MSIPKNTEYARYARPVSHNTDEAGLPAHPHTPRTTLVRGASWSLPVPGGVYAKIRAWDGREQWIAQLSQALHSPTGEAARRKISITHHTLMRIARADAAAAEARTGRDVTTAHDTVAATLKVAKRTVQRARALIQGLGYSVTVVPGRYLTRHERIQARNAHGNTQLKAASVRALTVPDNTRPVENVHLPRKGLRTYLPCGCNYLLKGAQARRAATRHLKRNKSRTDRPTVNVTAAHVAQELVTRLPFLAPWRASVVDSPGALPRIRYDARPVATIKRVIERSNLDTNVITGHDIMDVLNRLATEQNFTTHSSNTVKTPTAYLATLLAKVRSYIENTGYTTIAQREIARQKRRAELQTTQTARRQQDAELRARANTPQAIAARKKFFAEWEATKQALRG